MNFLPGSSIGGSLFPSELFKLVFYILNRPTQTELPQFFDRLFSYFPKAGLWKSIWSSPFFLHSAPLQTEGSKRNYSHSWHKPWASCPFPFSKWNTVVFFLKQYAAIILFSWEHRSRFYKVFLIKLGSLLGCTTTSIWYSAWTGGRSRFSFAQPIADPSRSELYLAALCTWDL